MRNRNGYVTGRVSEWGTIERPPDCAEVQHISLGHLICIKLYINKIICFRKSVHKENYQQYASR